MMRNFSKVVEMTSHELAAIVSVQDHCPISQSVLEQPNFMNRFPQSNYCEVNCTAARMSRPFGHIPIRNYAGLVDVRIELGLRLIIFRLLAPTNKMINSFLRTVSVIDN